MNHLRHPDDVEVYLAGGCGSEEELEKIHLNNRDLDDTDAKKLSETKEAINRLTAEEGYNKVQLMTQLFNISEEELLRLLQEKTNE